MSFNGIHVDFFTDQICMEFRNKSFSIVPSVNLGARSIAFEVRDYIPSNFPNISGFFSARVSSRANLGIGYGFNYKIFDGMTVEQRIAFACHIPTDTVSPHFGISFKYF